MPQTLFKDKSILITGGTGSFGKSLARRILQEDLCKKVIIFSRDEWKQWEMQRKDPLFSSPKTRYFIGDVRDLERLKYAFNEVHYVIHTAALKQVPAAEYNPAEAVKTNILGAMNIINAAISCSVEKVIALSTDKAVNPINLYGATKLCADRLFIAGNSYVGAKGLPVFSVARYGNVAGSRGSVLPFWINAVRRGAQSLDITDPRMTRFWITLGEAVDFVMNALKEMKGGEIFIPKIPSIKITDLAQALAPHLPQNIIGMRPGEKLHELLLSAENAHHTIEFDRYFTTMPEMRGSAVVSFDQFFREREKEGKEPGKKLLREFVYASNTNTAWLGVEELKTFLERFMQETD